MKTKFFPRSIGIILLSIATISFPSCLKDLNRSPFYGLNSETVYNDPANYIHVLAKCYAGLAMTGNQGGPSPSQPDISGINEGFSQYLRVLWNLEELPTDEAVCAWGDPGIPELHEMSWNSTNSFVNAMYNRIFYQIPLCNEFIRQSSDANMSSRGFSAADQTTIRGYHEEARFLRALSYYHAIDLFGNVPFVTDADAPGAFFPKQISRSDLFNYVESELLAVSNTLPDPKQNVYGRADKAAAWFLLARLYLNAEVYTGTQRYVDCITYCNKVISASYTLEPEYKNLFRADNNKSNEIIFPVCFDGINTETYGGTTFLVHAPVGGNMQATALDTFGIATSSGWAGYRTTAGLVNIFGGDSLNPKGDTLDHRNFLYTNGQNLQINSITTYADGLGVTKWRNVTSTGAPGSDPAHQFADTDFPLFRLGDAYLMYAEAFLRGGGGDMGTAVGYVNQLIERAYGNTSHDVASIDLNSLFDQRTREIYWEAQRRTDLIRFGLFTGGTYLWPWKGGVKEGISVPECFNLYPLALTDLVANPNLVQNFPECY